MSLDRTLRCWLAAICLGCPLLGVSAADAPAEMKIDGLGWWRNRQTALAIQRLSADVERTTWDANAVEDAVFLIVSSLAEQGYLQPQIEAKMTTPEGEQHTAEFDASLTVLLPRPFAATSVEFEIEPGVRYTIEAVSFQGLSVIPEAEARALLRPSSGLGWNAAERAYSPGRLRRSLEALAGQIRQLGYADAVVEAASVERDDVTGEVKIAVEVREGLRHEVKSIEVAVDGATQVQLPTLQAAAGDVWTSLWQQDLEAELRQQFYRAGHPDVSVVVSRTPAEVRGKVQWVEIKAQVVPGEEVRVGQVLFTGAGETREQVLRRRVTVQSGTLLDPVALEGMRYRLGQLGVFETVDLQIEPSSGPVRDAIFALSEVRHWDASLLAGYGSYERFRVGVELRQSNLFGRAHQSRLQLVQSTKSSRGDYTYTVPELFGERVDGSVRLFGFRREEPAFLREEYGASVLLRRPVPYLRADATVGYTFQSLRNEDNELETREVDLESVRVASVDLGLVKDRRDNPLRPRKGYRWFSQLEAASERLGGEVDYQRWEVGGTLHSPWGKSRWVHVGLAHGVITTLGARNDLDLPVNRRFYPGGDSSIRGYQAGEAAPRAADGRFLGAKSYLLLNAEVEQALTGNWSAVLFADALGTAVRLAEYPYDEHLISVGLGLRYQTLIGPLRLEYGHNLNRREGDPSGTLHFSVGFPF